jgi:hypothetical protein
MHPPRKLRRGPEQRKGKGGAHLHLPSALCPCFPWAALWGERGKGGGSADGFGTDRDRHRDEAPCSNDTRRCMVMTTCTISACRSK